MIAQCSRRQVTVALVVPQHMPTPDLVGATQTLSTSDCCEDRSNSTNIGPAGFFPPVPHIYVRMLPDPGECSLIHSFLPQVGISYCSSVVPQFRSDCFARGGIANFCVLKRKAQLFSEMPNMINSVRMS